MMSFSGMAHDMKAAMRYSKGKKKKTIGPKEQELFRIRGGEERGGKKYIMEAPKSSDKQRMRSIKPTRSSASGLR